MTSPVNTSAGLANMEMELPKRGSRTPRAREPFPTAAFRSSFPGRYTAKPGPKEIYK
jgi:hypothetical protein